MEKDDRQLEITEQDCADARALVIPMFRRAHTPVLLLIGIVSVAATSLQQSLAPDLSGFPASLLTAGLLVAIVAPVSWVTLRYGILRGAVGVRATSLARQRQLERDQARRELEQRLARAFEMADSEETALDVVGRALELIVPDRAAELLLADHSHAHFEAAAVSTASAAAPGCPVDAPDRCVAARRAQPMQFTSSGNLDACPELQRGAGDPCAACCVPVSIVGRTVGVLHTTGPEGELLDAPTVAALATLADEIGGRLGMLRVMAETQLQAATDALTGLLNRRSLGNQLRILQEQGRTFVLAMGDLDRFKALNDTHGQDTGDRALRLFADTLRRSMRPDDLVCRWGGEEFAIAMADISMPGAVAALERVREQLALAVDQGTVPRFTASFGVSGGAPDDDIDDVVARADAALREAKDAGRNRVTTAAPAALPVVETKGVS